MALSSFALALAGSSGCDSGTEDPNAGMQPGNKPSGGPSKKKALPKEPDWPAPKKKKKQKPAVDLPKDHPCWKNGGNIAWEKTLEDNSKGDFVRGRAFVASDIKDGEIFIGTRGYWNTADGMTSEAGFGLWSVDTKDASLKWSQRRVVPRLVEQERPVGVLRLKDDKLAYTVRETVGLHQNGDQEVYEFAAITHLHAAKDGAASGEHKLDGQMNDPKGEGPVAHSMVLAPDGGILVVGNTDKSDGDFSNNMPKLFFQKLGADLKVQWTRYYELIHVDENIPVPILIRGAVYLNDGSLAVLAEQHRAPGYVALVMMRFSAELQFIGENFFGWTTNINPQMIYLDSDQHIYLAGTFGELPKKPQEGDVPWNKGWVSKLDPQGNPEWSAVVPAPDSSLKKPEHRAHVTTMAVGPLGNVWIAGVYSFSHPEADPKHQRQEQVFIRKLDEDGLELWHHELKVPAGKISHDHPVQIHLDDKCNAYVVGNYMRSSDGKDNDEQRPFLMKIEP